MVVTDFDAFTEACITHDPERVHAHLSMHKCDVTVSNAAAPRLAREQMLASDPVLELNPDPRGIVEMGSAAPLAPHWAGSDVWRAWHGK